jgi:glutathione S-transferase
MLLSPSQSKSPAQPIRFYGFPLSGHAHRVQLFLSLIGVPFETILVNLGAGEHRQPVFLARNPFGQVPVIEDGALTLADSNAILVYLAQTYTAEGTWLPADPVGAAAVQRWLSVAAGDLAFGPALARVIKVFKRPADAAQAIALAERLFQRMETHLALSRGYFVGAAPTIADIALYSYTAHAPEGDVSLEPYPQIRAWLERIEALPGFVAMPRS